MAAARIAIIQPARPLPCRAAAAGPAAAGAEARPAFSILPSTAKELLQQAAWLRAEAFYEERSVGRFKTSFIKQFAGQHLYSLQQQTRGPDPECLTLVANDDGASVADAGPGSCLGTVDVRRLTSPGDLGYGLRWPDGVPTDAPGPAAYMTNVVVAPGRRRRGLGRALVAAAVAAAAGSWAARRVYCHVEVSNEPALQLYTGAGFSQLGGELPPEDGEGPRLLLCLPIGEA